MANPLRFRRSTERWTFDRVRSALRDPLDANLGTDVGPPWFVSPDGWEARRFDVYNGDTALFCWNDTEAYWVGNTETPEALWGTNKQRFGAAPEAVADWAQRELMAELHAAEPWLAAYPTLSWFFLPVLCSKDGRTSTRTFFRDHAMGFPDTDRDAALRYYESILERGFLDDDRHVMAGKLGTSHQVDLTRMRAAMAEFTVAGLLDDAAYSVTPEVEVTTGHSLDFRATRGNDGGLIEVTRPLPPSYRAAASPIRAIVETAETKTSGQLDQHGGGVTLFVDCSSFTESAFQTIQRTEPDLGHRPAVIFWTRPDGELQYYTSGAVPLDVLPAVA